MLVNNFGDRRIANISTLSTGLLYRTFAQYKVACQTRSVRMRWIEPEDNRSLRLAKKLRDHSSSARRGSLRPRTTECVCILKKILRQLSVE